MYVLIQEMSYKCGTNVWKFWIFGSSIFESLFLEPAWCLKAALLGENAY